MKALSQNQLKRLNYLEFRVYFTGCISRNDLIERFGISEAAATRDFALYREKAPGNIEIDPVTKAYQLTSKFKLKFLDGVEPSSILRSLIHGIGDDFSTDATPFVPCIFPASLQSTKIDLLAAVSRGITQKKIISVDYLSSSGGFGERHLVPFAIAGNGLRLHIRAYDRRRNRFGDFLINRMKSAKILQNEAIDPEEQKENDDAWNRMVNLEIVPHPNFKNKEMIELEFGMTDGVLHQKVRAAMAGYVLRLWNVDCTEDSSLSESRYCQLWLRNPLSLYGVSNAALAPGYKPTSK